MTAARPRDLLPRRADWYGLRRPGPDLLAGLTVAIVALPLALGFGVASGLGAAAGITTAIVAGVVAGAFGGSDYQVSGPTGAMTVVLVPIVAAHGTGGVLTVGLLAGLLLIALAFLRAGRYLRHLPAPVIAGFTAGIAAVIFVQQVPAALGRDEHGERVLTTAWHALTGFAAHPGWTPLALSGGVMAVMLIGGRWRPRLPWSLIAVAAATIAAVVLPLDAAPIGQLPTGLPAPSLGFVSLGAVPSLAGAAVAVAALAALESLLSATVADGMARGRAHHPDRELLGQGLANVVSPLFGGVPATAAIARTAVNVRAGARTRLATVTHALALAVIMLAGAPLVARIPLAALAGVLLATAVRMVEVGALAMLARTSRSDALVMALTATATLVLDLVTAVLIGLGVAGALALRKVALAVRLEPVPLDDGHPGIEQREVLAEHVAAYRIEGPLVFAAAHRFLPDVSAFATPRVLILRMSRVSAIDASGALVLRDTVDALERQGNLVYLTGTVPAHQQALAAVGLLDRLAGLGRVFPAAPPAIEAARAHLRATGVLAG